MIDSRRYRLGIELNLNRMPVHKPTDERNERELLNRLRTWIICYIMDRCICINLGKPFMIPEDEVRTPPMSCQVVRRLTCIPINR